MNKDIICNNLLEFYKQCKQRPYEYHSELLECNKLVDIIKYVKCNDNSKSKIKKN